ncbi:MAG: isocitrate lyase/PEP mutase family protein [Myxococcales bacterium]|nr:isocitrate lyase/PEP mutase family protein [Myxococcales bacterium]
MTRTSISELLDREGPVVGPGIWDALSATLAERAGFDMAFLSGFCMSAAPLAEPDFGLLTQTEVLATAERVCAAVELPIIVDIDTGYGNAFNVERTVEALLRHGAAGCFLEDQVWPKRCGHMEEKRVVPLPEYLPKLRAALEVCGGASFHVTARTDARAVHGLDEAIRRAKAFADAGADAVFVEAPRSIAELERVAREVEGVTLVANMVEQGKTPLCTPAELHAMGFSLVAFPVSGMLAAAHAIERVFRTIALDGTSAGCQGEMRTFDGLNDLVGLAERYAREGAWRGGGPG